MFTATTFYRICITLLGAISVRGDCLITPDENGLVVIPEGTDTIPADAFSDCAALKRVIIPASVENIGDAAFYNAGNLNRVFIKKGSILEGIGVDAFENCVSLTRINFPVSLKQIGYQAFRGSGLNKFIFKKGSQIEVIEDYVCKDCKELKVVILPASVKEIGVGAFSHGSFSISGLKKVIFKKGSELETISKDAFRGSGKLKTVILPPSVKEIMDSAFAYSGLKKIKFMKGSKLTTIGERAFYSNGSFKTINIPLGVDIKRSAFDYTGCPEEYFTPGATIVNCCVNCIVETKGLRGN